MKKFISVILIFMSLLISLMLTVHAHCPLCTAAVGTAAISAKYYGMDISIIGMFIGAFGISTGLWIALKISKKYFRFQFFLIVLLSYLLTVIPLLYISNESMYLPVLLLGSAGSLLNKVYWINKLLFGSIIGGFAALIAYFFHISIKKLNGKVLFPFQGIVITLLFLIISSLVLYFAFGA